MAHVWRSHDKNLQKLVLSFHHVWPRDRTQVIRCDSKSLYPLDHLTGVIVYKNMVVGDRSHKGQRSYGREAASHPRPWCGSGEPPWWVGDHSR